MIRTKLLVWKSECIFCQQHVGMVCCDRCKEILLIPSQSTEDEIVSVGFPVDPWTLYHRGEGKGSRSLDIFKKPLPSALPLASVRKIPYFLT